MRDELSFLAGIAPVRAERNKNVMHLAEGWFLIHLYRLSSIPEGFSYNLDLEVMFDVIKGDGLVLRHSGLLRRPRARTVTGEPITDALWIATETELTEQQLVEAEIVIVQVGREPMRSDISRLTDAVKRRYGRESAMPALTNET